MPKKGAPWDTTPQPASAHPAPKTPQPASNKVNLGKDSASPRRSGTQTPAQVQNTQAAVTKQSSWSTSMGMPHLQDAWSENLGTRPGKTYYQADDAGGQKKMNKA